MTRQHIAIIIVAVVFIVFEVWLGVTVSHPAPIQGSPYSAVYLSTGDIYFGKLSWLPTAHLENAWRLDRGVNAENEPQTSLSPLSSVFGGPSGEIYLNEKQIIFWARLPADSQIVKVMDEPHSAQQASVYGPASVARVSTTTLVPGVSVTP
jgi:hypothetical protein